MTREEAEKVLNAIDFKDGDNIVIINKNVYDKMKNEKQRLISFLKNKIKEIDKTIPSDLICAVSMRSDKLAELNAYQNILDFINKGGKNDD